MKQKLPLMLLVLATQSFAMPNILSSEDALNVVVLTSMDAFNSAFLHTPNIATDKFGTKMSLTATTMEFNDKGSFKLSRTELNNNDNFKQKSSTRTGDVEEVWSGKSILNNPYIPGGINQVLNLATQEHTEEYTETLSTSTTCGWNFTKDYFQETSVTHQETAGIYKDIYTLEVTGKITASTTDTVTTSTTFSDTAKSFTVPVPAGCKAVVTQSLGRAAFSGEYTISNKIGNDSQIEFNVGVGSANKHDQYLGYVKVMDLINSSRIPQSSLAIESGNLVVKGKGTYSAMGTSSYIVHVEYLESDPGTNYCMAPSQSSFEQSISNSDDMRTSSIINQKPINPHIA